jgi:hypothetical protein
MTSVGNHMKFNVHKSLRERVPSFYLDVLQCTTLMPPLPNRTETSRCVGMISGP